MKEVSCRVILMGVQLTERHGLPTESFFDGIDLPREYLLDPRNRVDWAVWVRYMENAYRVFGSRERWVAINGEFASTPGLIVWRKALSNLVEPARLFRFFATAILPLNYGVITVAAEAIGPNRLRLKFTIPKHLPGCEVVIWSGEGVLATLPMHAGLPRAKVTLEEYSPHHGVFLVELAPSGTWWARWRAWCHGAEAKRSTEDIIRQQFDELRLSHAELERQAGDFRGVLDASTDAVAVVRDGRVLYANPALAELLGAESAAAMIGGDSARWLAAEDLAALRQWAATGGSGGRREVALYAGGRPGVFAEIAPPRTVTWEDQPAVLWMLTDITERRALERAYARASEREQERIARDLHDSLGQQLTAVALQLRLLERRLGGIDDAAARQTGELAALVSDATRQARDLAHGLAAGEVVRSGLPAALNHLAVATSGLFPMVVEVHGTDGAAAAFGLLSNDTALQLYRAVQEALTNAHRHGRARTVELRMEASAEALTLEIEDDGKGMAEPPDGARAAGMGLKIMGHRLASVGGTVLVAPGAEGRGVRVQLRLPWRGAGALSGASTVVADAGAVATREGPVRAPGPPAERGVVVIDDHAMVRAGLVQLLGQTRGFSVLGEAGNRQEALAVCRERRPGVVLCDVQLGTESGVELMRELRALLPESRIVALSMYAEELHGPAARAAGADAFVGKQAGPEVLVAALG